MQHPLEESNKLFLIQKELAFEIEERKKRTAELAAVNIELSFQKKEKAKRAVELVLLNKAHDFQNDEKEKRAIELGIANKELILQNEEKGKRSAELIIAYKELAFQNEEKEKRAAELRLANIELLFQNKEKEKRAAELIIANKELAFQNEEKVKRAAELIIANIELAFQNEEKEKRAIELSAVNKELGQFAYVASHDLQQPLRTVSNYIRLFERKYAELFDDEAQKYLTSVNNATKRMSLLIKSLLTFSELGNNKKLNHVDCKTVVNEVIADLETLIKTSNTHIDVENMPVLNIYKTEMRQLFQNLITNAIKFQKSGAQPKIRIACEEENGKWKFSVHDNGIGIDAGNFEKIFDIFHRLHSAKEYEGSGIGLANCKKIVQLHHGEIWLESTPGQGTTFYFSIPDLKQE